MIYKVVYAYTKPTKVHTLWYILWDKEANTAKLRYPTKPILNDDHYPAEYVEQSIRDGYWTIEGDPFDLWVAEVREEAGL
jgi:hypothetical protein